jgi:hypothetical protein|tara:strand:- start:1286 stop:1831 length:546 start_codon:yes stop_codon:yes gene_type:complete
MNMNKKILRVSMFIGILGLAVGLIAGAILSPSTKDVIAGTFDEATSIIIPSGFKNKVVVEPLGEIGDEPALGGLVQFGQPDFPDGLKVDGTAAIDGSRGGAFTTLTATGATTLSGAITSSGTNSFTGANTFLQSASTTVTVGSATIGGCFSFGDDDNGGLTYITTLNGVVQATTTQPSICQ